MLVAKLMILKLVLQNTPYKNLTQNDAPCQAVNHSSIQIKLRPQLLRNYRGLSSRGELSSSKAFSFFVSKKLIGIP